MNKGIILVDIPDRCEQCRFSAYGECGIGFCKAAKEYIDSDDKPGWCPIMPMMGSVPDVCPPLK